MPKIPCRCGQEGPQCMIHNPPFAFLAQERGKKSRFISDVAQKMCDVAFDAGMKIDIGLFIKLKEIIQEYDQPK